MTSPVKQIEVACPCGTVFQTWYRPSMNLAMESFSPAYIRKMTTAECPQCKQVLDLGSLIVGEDGGWRFGADGIPSGKKKGRNPKRRRKGSEPDGKPPA